MAVANALGANVRPTRDGTVCIGIGRPPGLKGPISTLVTVADGLTGGYPNFNIH